MFLEAEIGSSSFRKMRVNGYENGRELQTWVGRGGQRRKTDVMGDLESYEMLPVYS